MNGRLFSKVLQLRKEGFFWLNDFRVIHSAAVRHVFQEYSRVPKGGRCFPETRQATVPSTVAHYVCGNTLPASVTGEAMVHTFQDTQSAEVYGCAFLFR